VGEVLMVVVLLQVTASDEYHEAEIVADIAEEIMVTGRVPGYPDHLPPLSLKDLGVLYRTNVQVGEGCARLCNAVSVRRYLVCLPLS
jgi:hypothetical protein